MTETHVKQEGWKHVKVPAFFKEKLKQMSEREKRAIWQIIYDAFTYYESQKRKPRIKEELSILDKISWYIAKVSMATCWYLATLSDTNYELTVKTITDTGARLGVDMSELLSVLETFKNIKQKTSKHRALVLKALKKTIQDMILLMSQPQE
jgi:hypothetical protein